ncbi:MAG: immunoglobulin domain-containing protein [Candidatus Didemnitutus sp.]|nr:immunoglobulin domain-containing protein [Candidatus Didemnitutus sp.]
MNKVNFCFFRPIWIVLITTLIVRAEDPSPAPYYFTTLAGTSNIGNADGTGKAARFYSPIGAAFDRAGNLWVADTYNHTIRKITPAGVVTTVAGLAGFSGATDGTGDAARFNYPAGLALDGAGNIYVAESRNHTVRRITPAGVVTTVAGLAATPGSVDGTGNAARFNTPEGIAIDGAGNLYVADTNNSTIRKITATGVVTTFAGKAETSGATDGLGEAARFKMPTGLAVDAAGNVFVADSFNHTIRRITPAGAVTTVAGLAGSSGAIDGSGSTARFSIPEGVTADLQGNLYVAEGGNCTIRKIDPTGAVSTIAGQAGRFGWKDGTGSAALFNFPNGVAVDASNGIFVTDTYNSTIRRITPDGVVTTFAGSAESRGSADGTGDAARFNLPGGVTVDGTGNVYVADTSNNTIRRITPDGVVTTLAGTAGQVVADSTTGQVGGKYADGTGSAARFFSPTGVALDAAGNVFVSDTGNCVIRRITPAGAVTTLAGNAETFGWADGTGTGAIFFEPVGLVVTGANEIFVADSGNHVIRRITPAGVVTTFAGQPRISGSDDGTGTAARFNRPRGLALDASGNLYVGDTYNHTIRKITPAGVVTTVAGLAGSPGLTDGPGNLARLNSPGGLAIDQSGNIYLADSTNHTFRRISPSGEVTTLAGKGGTDGSADGLGNSARFFYPNFVALDAKGVAYVTDGFNNTIRQGQLAAAPVAIEQPKNLSVSAGSSVTFSVKAVAVPAPTYQWQFNGQPFSGATGSTLSFNNARASDAGEYSVTITNALGSVTSGKATLTVTPASAPPPTGGGSSSGGGGAPSEWFLATLLSLVALRTLRRAR